MKMELFGENGHCSADHYKSLDTIKDVESCIEKCIADEVCHFMSFNADESCRLYKKGDCKLTVTPESKSYKTYKKVEKGKNILTIDSTRKVSIGANISDLLVSICSYVSF